MKKREKIVQQAFLDDEERVIKRLQCVYGQALKDLTQKSNDLQNRSIGFKKNTILLMMKNKGSSCRARNEQRSTRKGIRIH